MAQQARDEAGNIWNVDDQGNPISLAQPAPAQGGGGQFIAKPVDPSAQYEAPKAAADLARAQQAIGIAADRAPLDAESTRLANEKARRELAAPPKEQQEVSDRMSRLMQLARQVGRTQHLYNTGIGTTKGFPSGLKDYLPTDSNARFDVAGASLSQQGLAAFRVPGTGTVSDRDAMMFDRANLPTASTRDVAVEEQLLSIRSRVDEELKALGKPPLDWSAIERQAANPEGRQRQDDAAIPTLASGGGGSGGNPPTPPSYNGPAGYDVAGVAGGVSGGPGGAGSTFANAAGVAMAEKLKDAYNQGAGVSQLNELLRTNGFQEFTDPQSIEQIQKRGPLNFAPPPMDDTRGAVGRAMGSVADSAPGAYAISAADALTAGTLDNIAGGPAGLAQDYARQQYPGASLLGSVTGGALAAGGAELGLARAGLTAGRAALGGDALYGAAYGAGSSDGGNRLLGAAVGGTGGLAGGIAGRAAARGIGGALTGVRNADVQGLRQAGVPLTAGQVAGGTLKGIEDRLSGIPVVGDMVNARRLEGFQGFNRAAFDEALAPIGANTGGAIGEQGVDAARGVVGNAYDQALTGVRVQADAPFVQDMTGAIQAGRSLPDPMSTRADYTLNTRVGNSFGPNGELDGRGFQQSLRGLQRDAAAVRNEPYGYDFGQVTDQARDALEGMLTRQAPGVLPQYNAANQAFRQTEVLRDAVNRARNGTRVGETGTFAPSQLADAAAGNARRFGNSQGTTRQPFFDLSRAGQAVLPNSVPDSGTAGRAVVASGLGLLGAGGAGGYAAGDTSTGAGLGLGAAALLAAGGSRTGQRALTSLLADRPDALIQLGDQIQRRARYGGIFGAPLLAGGATALLPQ